MKNLLVPVMLMSIYAISGCKKRCEEPPVKKAMVSTIAGQYNGFGDGTVENAQFDRPADVVVTNDGAIYVADYYNRRIRKIYGGMVTTFAGSGSDGYLDSAGAEAGFPTPQCITADQYGNLYSTDANDPRVRKIIPSAFVTTYAGMADEGYADGAAATAKFRSSDGIATDKQGNVYVADTYNNRIRKISPTGYVTTVAGNGQAGHYDGPGSNAKFDSPHGIVADKNGNVYVCDVLNYRIRKITPNGQVTTLCGNGEHGIVDGDRTTAQLGTMQDITIDKHGNLYVTDSDRIRKVSPNGTVTTIAGGEGGNQYKDGEGPDARFFSCKGIGIDAEGNLYVADAGNHRIRKISFE